MEEETSKEISAQAQRDYLEQYKIVSRLVARKYPLANKDFVSDDYRHQASEYRKGLNAKSLDFLREMEKQQIDADRKQAIEEEEKRERDSFFNREHAKADLTHWAQRACWPIEAAVALLFEKNPDVVTPDNLRRNSNSSFVRNYVKLFELVRSHLGGQLTNPVAPVVFLRWAQRYDQPIPIDLLNAVEKYGGNLRDWQDAYKAKEEEVEKWKATAEKLDRMADKAIEQARHFLELYKAQASKITELEEQIGSTLTEPEDDESAQATPPTVERRSPSGGDSLTPLIWEICYDRHAKELPVTARYVMTDLQRLADSEDVQLKKPLLSSTGAGVKYELFGAIELEKELSYEALKTRINAWRNANGLVRAAKKVG